jgi:hypothetical protein
VSMTPREGEILSEIIDFLAKRDDELATKLRDVVEALVTADRQLSERISLLELDNGTWPVMDGLEDDRRSSSTIRRVLRWLWSPPERY